MLIDVENYSLLSCLIEFFERDRAVVTVKVLEDYSVPVVTVVSEQKAGVHGSMGWEALRGSDRWLRILLLSISLLRDAWVGGERVQRGVTVCSEISCYLCC